jgi:hypothetical protein
VGGAGDPGRRLAPPEVEVGQRLERREQPVVQVLAAEQAPLVEVGGVGEGEAGEEVVLVEGDRVPQGGRVGRGGTGLRPRLEGRDVEPDAAAGVEPDRLAVAQQVAPDPLAQLGQDFAQVRGGAVPGQLAPEQGGEGVAGVGTACDGEVDQQGRGLPPRERQRRPAEGDPGRAE